MTPLQLSSFALKQSSGPVGVHPAVTTIPSVGRTFLATTFAPGEEAPGEAGPHAATTARSVRTWATALTCRSLGGHDFPAPAAARALRFRQRLARHLRVHQLEERLASHFLRRPGLGFQRHERSLLPHELEDLDRLG